MASINKCIFVGRLTRAPEKRDFNGGGAVANFSIAVDGDRKKDQNGEWITEPCFLDCKAFDNDKGPKLATLVCTYLDKGSLLYVEGYLVLEKWTNSQDGSARQAHKLRVTNIMLLGNKNQQQESQGEQQAEQPPSQHQQKNYKQNKMQTPPDDDIPF